MKKKTIYVVVILWLVLFSQIVVNRLFVKDEVVIEAFNSTQSNVLESSVDAWGNLGSGYYSESDRENLVKILADAIGLQDYELENIHNDEKQGTILTKRSKNGTTIIQFFTIYEENKDKGVQNHILVNLTIFKNTNAIMNYKRIIDNEFEKLNLAEEEVFLRISGIYDGKLTASKEDLIVEQLLKVLQAKIVAENRKEELYSLYAYTGLINNYITSSNMRINANAVLRYDKDADKTYIYLATPILNVDY